MIIWILLALDFLAFGVLSLAQFDILFLSHPLLVSGIYLIFKGALFRDVMSIIDALCGIYVLFVLFFNVSSIFYYFILAWFLYKFASTAIG